MLALLVAATGTTGSLLVARMWIRQWAASGQMFPIGQWCQVDVPESALQSLVYYESDHGVSSQFMRLYIRDRFGERFPVRVPASSENEFAIAGRQGRALFRLNLVEAGTYEFRCDNPNYASDEDIPAADRVVFFKSPNTRAGVLQGRRLILTVGGTLTIALTLSLYVVHVMVLHRRPRDEQVPLPVSRLSVEASE